jgi:hypothetical protein
MAQILPIAAQALAVFQTANTIAQVFNDSDGKADDLALRQLEQQQQLQQSQALQDAANDKAQIAVATQAAEDERRLALKRAVARQKAAFGGQGIASGDGSSEAVLLGLFQESEDEKQSRERLDKLRLQAIDQGLAQSVSANTLTRTQTAEKNKLTQKNDIFNDIDTVLGAF